MTCLTFLCASTRVFTSFRFSLAANPTTTVAMKRAFAVAYAATASADEGSPIGKVIEMILDLQAKIIKEGEEVQKTYEEFSEWCEEGPRRSCLGLRPGRERSRASRPPSRGREPT